MHCETTLKSDKLKLGIYDSIALVPKAGWNQLAGKNIYLEMGYLQALESTLSQDIEFRYITFYDKDYTLVGIAVVQLLNVTSNEMNIEALRERFGEIVPERVLTGLDARVLLCGNAFATGEHGFKFSSHVPEAVISDNLERALNRIKRDEARLKNRISIYLLKEFWATSSGLVDVLKADGFNAFEIEPNMVVHIDSDWTTFEDYLSDLTTKYRTKVKSIYKKSENLTYKRLTAVDIANEEQAIEVLYNNVLAQADYKLASLNAHSFTKFAEACHDKFFFNAYYLDGEMVGFGTCSIGENFVDGNFVGLNYEQNHTHAIYQRILVDFIKIGIESRVTHVNFGRTATELKSTLGATPVQMTLMAKHRNRFTNHLIKPLISHIPAIEITTRKPFKEVYYAK